MPCRFEELWTKFAAEFVILNTGLYRRTHEEEYLFRARQSAGFLIQSARHGFSPKYNAQRGGWQERGWQSSGRAVEAFLNYTLSADQSTHHVRGMMFLLDAETPC